MEDIGSLLKNAREQQNLTLAQISKRISIDIPTLTKLEENRFAEIAAPVFIRGYLKLYAQQLGLSEAQIQGILTHSFGHHPELHLSEANIESQRKSFRRNHTASWLLLMMLLAGVVTIAAQILNRESWLMRQIRATFPTEVAQDFPSQSGDTLRLNPVAQSEEALPAAPPIQLESLNTPSQPPLQLESASTEETTATAPNLELESASVAENTETTSENDTPSSEAKAAVELRVQGETWLQIIDAQKRRIVSNTIKAGKVFELDPAAAPYQISIGRPSVVQLWVNGQRVDLKQYAVPNTKARYTVNL